ncbi:hypothetical protein ADEAN_000104200 [Angomonas deanei]|uniref:Uncharacterized protein n=1 Tax=Angomonas deanei TaxID=59799 RepID=A0A7G2C1R2_9TRYP|nr:hypothetical protein ADEAN_000104200 [Angomonas deanei]
MKPVPKAVRTTAKYHRTGKDSAKGTDSDSDSDSESDVFITDRKPQARSSLHKKGLVVLPPLKERNEAFSPLNILTISTNSPTNSLNSSFTALRRPTARQTTLPTVTAGKTHATVKAIQPLPVFRTSNESVNTVNAEGRRRSSLKQPPVSVKIMDSNASSTKQRSPENSPMRRRSKSFSRKVDFGVV